MNLPTVLTTLLAAQARFNSTDYANCYSDTAIVFDEGAEHLGRLEIQNWFEETGNKYRSVHKPLSYVEVDNGGVLISEVSGTFPGSPIVLQFHYTFTGELIEKLEVKS